MFAFNINPLTKLLAAVAMFSVISTFAADGTKDGGGGGAYVCRNADGAILKSMLADLWEAEKTPFRWPNHKGKLHVSKSNEDAKQQFQKALSKLASADPKFAAMVGSEMEKIWAGLEIMPEDVSIAVPDDLKVGYFPTGCAPEGMMFYNDEADKLHIREDIFQKLETQTDVAAAWMHEAVYKILREKALHQTSKYARRLVACLFSANTDCLAAKQAEIPTDRVAYQCTGETFELLAVPEEKITDPKSFLSGSHKLRVIYTKTGKLGLRYSPENIQVIQLVGNEVGSYRDFSKGRPGLLAFATAPRIELYYWDLSRHSGELTSVVVQGYRHLHEGPQGYADPEWIEAKEALACKRIR